MWWDHAGWEPLYGMWFMPIFGLLCMLLFIFFISRIFNRNGGCCGPFNQKTSRDTPDQAELLDEIKALRREVEELREKQKGEH
ncbi:MAG TPA: hypothetical protein ENK96_04490 [Desulfobulbaceae bacterium]|nr:hypothetical protein [Desulfobulbaceae bacterium]